MEVWDPIALNSRFQSVPEKGRQTHRKYANQQRGNPFKSIMSPMGFQKTVRARDD